jgi:hypothetical protein
VLYARRLLFARKARAQQQCIQTILYWLYPEILSAVVESFGIPLVWNQVGNDD